MLKLKIKPEAERDLTKIFEYTATTWGLKQAERYQDDLFEGMKLITNNPNIGNQYPFAQLPYRKLLINRHLIFYRIENEACIVTRVLHHRMDIKQHLKRK